VVLGGVGETIGWSGRLWGSKNPTSMNPYLMQITTTIASPTFILATNFETVRRIILKVGPQYSRLKPHLYMIVFCTCDVIALVVQSVGGGIASVAATTDDSAGTEKGGHIALGGIVFQFVAILVYMLLVAEFLVRYHLDKPFPRREGTLIGRSPKLDSKTRQMVFGVGFSSLCIFIRGIYRTVELTEGWSGAIISNQRLFIGLDGTMILLSMVFLNIFHPGRLMLEEANRHTIEPLSNVNRTDAVGEEKQQTTLSAQSSPSIYPDDKKVDPFALSTRNDTPDYGGSGKGAKPLGNE